MNFATFTGGVLSTTLKPTSVGDIKLQLSDPLTYMESSEARAFTYHSSVSILEHQSLLYHPYKISVLSDIVGYPFVGDQQMTAFQQQWKDPSSYGVTSFHGETGGCITTATITDDDYVLLSLGDDTHPIAMAMHHPENIYFAHVRAS